MELIGELQLSLMNTGFVFEENNTDHIVISFSECNGERSFIGFRTIIDLQDGIPESSFSQKYDTKSMAKSLAVKQEHT
jgi:DNA mismatch repair protein MutL